MSKKLSVAMLSLAMLLSLGIMDASRAASVTLPLLGSINEVNDPTLTINVGDPLSGTLTYDDSEVASSGFDDIPVDMVTLTFPGLRLTKASDPFAMVTFQDGAPVGLNFFSFDLPAFGVPTQMTSALDFFMGGIGFDFTFTNEVGAEVVAGQFQVVPVPAAAPLFGAALACLAMLGQRRTASIYPTRSR